MDKDAVRNIVEAHVKDIRWALQVQDWNVDIAYGTLEPGCMAEVSHLPEYRKAKITFDPAQHETEEQVVRSLMHELLHLVLNPVVGYRRQVRTLVHREASDMEYESWRQAEERVVGNLERLLAWGIGYRPWEPDAPKKLESDADSFTGHIK